LATTSLRKENTMKRMTGVLGGLFLLVALCGCEAVYSKHPVGLEPVQISPEMADKLEGIWAYHGPGAVTVRVADAENGILEIAWVEPGMDGLELRSAEVHLREANGWTFASVTGEDAPEDLKHMWGRIEGKRDRMIIVWAPDVDKFKELVKEGELPGEVDEGGDVVLGELEDEHYDIITDEDSVVLDWEDPLVFIRVGD